MPAELIKHMSYINMIPGVSPPPVINVSQYDDGFRIIFYPVAVSRGIIPKYPAPVSSDVDLYDIFPTNLLNPTLEVRGTKTDGNGYSAQASYSTANDAFIITGNKQMTAVAGDNIFEVVVTGDDGETELATANFILRVERAALDKDTIVSESVIRELIDVTDQAEAIVAAAQQILSTIDTTLTQQGKAAEAKAVGTALSGKVDKVPGKGLSTEDYTTAEKTKLSGIEAGATATSIDSTLTQTGEAADAKAVGDALASLSAYTFTDANNDGHIVITAGGST